MLVGCDWCISIHLACLACPRWMSKDSRYARNTKSSWKSTNSCCFRRLWPNPCCCFWKIKGFDLFLPAIVTLVALELEEVDHRNVFRKFFLKAFMPGHLIFGRLHAMENHLWADSNRKAEKAEQTSNEWIHCTSRPDLHILTIWKFLFSLSTLKTVSYVTMHTYPSRVFRSCS